MLALQLASKHLKLTNGCYVIVRLWEDGGAVRLLVPGEVSIIIGYQYFHGEANTSQVLASLQRGPPKSLPPGTHAFVWPRH